MLIKDVKALAESHNHTLEEIIDPITAKANQVRDSIIVTLAIHNGVDWHRIADVTGVTFEYVRGVLR